MKHYAFLDSLRVFASLGIITSHYVELFIGTKYFDIETLYLFHISNIAVFSFFVLSGYLIPASLERASSLWNFYKRKLIRVVIPFTTAYLVLGAILLALGLIDPKFYEQSPFSAAIQNPQILEGIFLAMFPVEVNVIKFLDFPLYWFVGEWFMGTLIVLYFFAPILNFCVKRSPIPAMLIAIIISVISFYALAGLEDADRIFKTWWVPITRIPEFILGMIFFTYKDFFAKHQRKFLIVASIWVIIFGVYSANTFFEDWVLWEMCYPLSPRSMLMSFPTAYLLFNLFEYLNKQFPKILAKFNSFSDISYMVMLTQHVVLFAYAAEFDFSTMQTFDFIFMFAIITLTIIFLSAVVKKISDSIEKFFILNFVVK